MTTRNTQSQPRRRPPEKRGHPVLRVLGTLFLIGVVTCAMLACLAVMYVKIIILPNSEVPLTDISLNLTTSMYYTDPATGADIVMQTLHGDENRVWVDYDDIPVYMRNAAVAIEDHRFLEHKGVDWLRTARGVLSMFTGQDIQGGSTITQQLIKNLTTEDQVTVKRKVTEIFRALEFERDHEKDEILEWYLNYIYLGEQCYGVYTASYTYFNKHVSDLSLAECASIIGITNNPSRYDPYGTLRVEDPETGEILTCRDFNKQRQETILWRMLDLGMISQEEYDAAMAEELQFVRGEGEDSQANIYTWYEDAVIDQVIADLQTTLNLSERAAAAMVYSGGLQIYTCMNPYVQNAVDAVYNDRSNLNYTSGTGQAMQSSITVVHNETGEVVAMAGGIGEKTQSRAFNRATRAQRPPGSSIKPLSVYAPALELGVLNPLGSEVDSPYEDGWPVNSYGSYRGRMSITEAVRVSCNTIAVKILAEKVTPEVSFQFMRDRFHIDLVEQENIGGSVYSDIGLAQLGLGGLTHGVTTYDMAAAYSVFPRNGVYITPRVYSRVLDNDGNVLLENEAVSDVVLKDSTTYYTTNMLETVINSGTGTNAKFSGMALAGKTGTTSSRKDLWFVGYSPYYTAAVWTGYDVQERVSGGSNPSTGLWRQVMQQLHSDLPYQDFSQPDSGRIVSVRYCTVSGRLATDYCVGHVDTANMLQENVPSSYCTVHTEADIQPPAFNIDDPTTWPADDPNFDPSDPTTYPGAAQDPGTGEGGEGTGEGAAEGGETTPPPETGEAVPTQ